MTNTTTANWITLRSVDPEFLAFFKVSTAEQAIDAATQRCTDADGQFQESVLSAMKIEYLAFVRQSMGLPANAGTF